MTARPDVPDTPDRTDAALATIDEVRALPVVATLTIPLWDRASVENEIHTSRTSATVPVVIKPDLPILGHVLYEHHYATTEVFIVLREWNEQVLLHEVLHVILGPGPVEDPDNHRIVNAVEVGLAPFFVARSPWGDVVADAFKEWPAYWACRCGASGTTTRREAAEKALATHRWTRHGPAAPPRWDEETDALFVDAARRAAPPREPQPTPEAGEGAFWNATPCKARRDGDCDWIRCPQLRDGEPAATGRHCPLDTHQSEPVERITDANGDETERGADTDTENTHQQDGDHR